MLNTILFEDEEVNELSKKFFEKIVNVQQCLEEFTQAFDLFETYGVEQILGIDDGDVRLSFDQLNIIWENYKTINYKFKYEDVE